MAMTRLCAQSSTLTCVMHPIQRNMTIQLEQTPRLAGMAGDASSMQTKPKKGLEAMLAACQNGNINAAGCCKLEPEHYIQVYRQRVTEGYVWHAAPYPTVAAESKLGKPENE